MSKLDEKPYDKQLDSPCPICGLRTIHDQNNCHLYVTKQPVGCAELALYEKVKDTALRDELIRLYKLRQPSDGRSVDWKKEWRGQKREVERLRKMLLAEGIDFRDGSRFKERE